MNNPFIKSVEVVEVRDGDRIKFSESEKVVYDPLNRAAGEDKTVDVVVRIQEGSQERVDLIKEDGEMLLSFSQVMVREIVDRRADIHSSVTYHRDLSGFDKLTRSFVRGYQADITWKVEKQ